MSSQCAWNCKYIARRIGVAVRTRINTIRSQLHVIIYFFQRAGDQDDCGGGGGGGLFCSFICGYIFFLLFLLHRRAQLRGVECVRGDPVQYDVATRMADTTLVWFRKALKRIRTTRSGKRTNRVQRKLCKTNENTNH